MEEKMTEKQEVRDALNFSATLHVEKMAAQSRCSELADEFTRLEVQLAAILIAFAGVSLNFFEDDSIKLSPLGILIIKFIYASSVFLLILSLVLGLIHLKRKEKFWDESMHIKYFSMKKWREYMQRKTTYAEARAYHDGLAREKAGIIHSPFWTWILQTLCLGLAFVLFFILFVVLLFK